MRMDITHIAQLHSFIGAAQKLGLSRSTLYLEMEAGRLQFVKVGKRRLISEVALHAYIDSLVAESAAKVAVADPTPEAAEWGRWGSRKRFGKRSVGIRPSRRTSMRGCATVVPPTPRGATRTTLAAGRSCRLLVWDALRDFATSPCPRRALCGASSTARRT
ncbi:helix-turn-helix domain-containing protein [Mycobacterium pseudoshottsii]|uniref:helix-turn-helix domain-containing protein n=3 Tax=Mycobacterium TaxID=1763 RepID=UPI0009FD61B8|nr:helix-turn-helix domain-containing protein [Mycobacterium pseudoshottsii]